MIGIQSYGFYVPSFRIKVKNIARVWGKKPEDVQQALRVTEKAVSEADEDALTMGYEASVMATKGSDLIKKIGAVFVGSESHPYVVNPTSTILGEFLGIEGQYLASDLEFACKAATGALITSMALAENKKIRSALVVAADKAQAKPHDPLEYTASSGAVAMVVGADNVCVEVLDWASFSSDTPDFWRREGNRYPSHGGRFTGKPSYFYHITESSKAVFEKSKLHPKDFAHAIFHSPNGKFPERVAKQLGFSKDQLKQSLVVDKLGNSYTASALMGLVSVLEIARPGDLLFLSSFGSGAGSDSFVLRATKHLEQRRQKLSLAIADKEYIDYPTYLKYMGVI